MQQVKKARDGDVHRVRFDSASLDRIKWIQAVLAHVMPDVRTPSTSVIVRRALEAYANFLGNNLTPVAKYPSVSAEQAHLMVASQNNRSWFKDGQFPAEELVKDGLIQNFAQMERAARVEQNQGGINELIQGRKTGKGV